MNKGYIRDVQGIPKGYPTEQYRRNTGPTPTQYSGTSLWPTVLPQPAPLPLPDPAATLSERTGSPLNASNASEGRACCPQRAVGGRQTVPVPHAGARFRRAGDSAPYQLSLWCPAPVKTSARSEEHTSELQSLRHL